MPSNLMFADSSFPKIERDEDVRESVRKIQNYLYMLLEQLRYTLQNLSFEENFTESGLEDFIEKLRAGIVVAQTVIAQGVITETLYAEQGDIAQLTVDWLDTSKRIRRYLTGDLTDDNYIEIHNQSVAFVTASVRRSGETPLTEQLVNRYGNPMYWAQDIAGAEIVGGYPFVDGVQVYTTRRDTGFPVTVYQYDRAVKREIAFRLDTASGYYIPTDVFGAGDADGFYKGRLEKFSDYLSLGLELPGGKFNGVYFGADGYADGLHLRKPTKLDFSGLRDGGVSFSEQIDGGGMIEYTVARDAQGRIVQLTDGDGHATEVVW